MKRVKKRWDLEYPEYANTCMQKLRDNASRFKLREPEVKNLMLVRTRNGVDLQQGNEQ